MIKRIIAATIIVLLLSCISIASEATAPGSGAANHILLNAFSDYVSAVNLNLKATDCGLQAIEQENDNGIIGGVICDKKLNTIAVFSCATEDGTLTDKNDASTLSVEIRGIGKDSVDNLPFVTSILSSIHLALDTNTAFEEVTSQINSAFSSTADNGIYSYSMGSIDYTYAFIEGRTNSFYVIAKRNSLIPNDNDSKGADAVENNAQLPDAGFFKALEKAVKSRLASEGKSDESRINTEYTFLKDYISKSFWGDDISNSARIEDETIRIHATKYIQGLSKQKQALSEKMKYEQQKLWFTGAATRYEQLSFFYENYGFMSDNDSFIGEYIANCAYMGDYSRAINNVSKVIETHVVYAAKNNMWEEKNGYVVSTFTNNTDYSFSIQFYFYIYGDEEMNQLIDTRTSYIENIKPGNSFTPSFYYKDINREITFVTDWDIIEIK